MNRFIICIFSCLTLAACQSTTGYDAPPQTASSGTASDQRVTGDIGALLNYARQSRGLAPLSHNPVLERVALAHANDMARRGYFSHTGKDGSTPQSRLRAEGYRACLTAENIAAGQVSATEVMKDWMQSRGHRENILRSGLSEFGVAKAGGGQWVLVLARPGC